MMATEIVMPNLGFDAQQGRLIEWLKQPGDSVQKGEIIAVVESDKANVELESVASGVVLELLSAAGEEVSVGAVIARIGQPGETPAKAASPPPAVTVEVSPVARRLAAENQIDLGAVKGSGRGGRIMREDVEALMKAKVPKNGQKSGVLALPKVRKAAREAGIDLAQVTATGVHGEVTLADIENHLRVVEPEPEVVMGEGAREVPLSRLRQVIGERLSQSMQEAPHFYVSGAFDLEAALTRLRQFPDPQPRINDLLQYLTVQVLLRVPQLNATFERGHLYVHGSVNLAVAVAREDGLITPVIPRAERYSLQGLAAESRALIQRARENRLKPDDLQGGTFTISNLGVIQQVEQFTAVINPPQVAILAVGTVKQRAVVVDGGLHIRHTVHMTLSGDHRVVDGMHLGQFMAAFQAELDRFSGA
ncbi:MAG: 2-oxo acid dehydrogenase subunit E2 [Anaerolineae bacterium]|nr:2-oxo acid dehydrogenase subunit E2 [Anaerolineae bacterium]